MGSERTGSPARTSGTCATEDWGGSEHTPKFSTNSLPCPQVVTLISKLYGESNIHMERKASAQISELSNSYHFKVEIRAFLTQHRQMDQDVVLGKSEVAVPMWLPLSQLGGNHRANGMYHRSGIGRSISNMSDSPAYFSIAFIPSFFLYLSTAVASFHQVASVPFAHQMLRALLWMRSSPCPR